MDETELGQIIGKNITRLRKTANMTQLELAEKLSYSDKSVSKWEQGNGIPDVRILMQIAELFGVTLDDLVHEQREHKLMPKTLRIIRRTVIITCSALLVWLVAVVAFVLIRILAPSLDYSWLAFVYAVPVSFVVVLVFACVWKYKWLRTLSVSVIIWTTLGCVYLTVYACAGLIDYMWLLFLIGVPLQLLTLFFLLGWRKLKFFKKK
ncbi:MAG: helix-turn-helix domain-containing protein [Clostridia bacterium]|nr:helix-turn-helix domain-containing protein [Clostridia bacterium]